jgi:serine/threonine-protein kinase
VLDLPDRLAEALKDRYTLERQLGAGGMATVYLAEDRKHHRRVAIKVLKPELAAALGPDRFLREIELSARLTHPHILPLHDSGNADGFLYYVMPYVEGESLRDRLDREKQLPLDDALQIAREVADALSYAHSHGVIHRDIKPDNILLQSGHAVVADFGIARAVDHAGGDRLTETGMSLGTPAYMSPEQAAASPDLDGRSDLYSLGCVLYEMLAGQPPFSGPTAGSVVAQHLAAAPPDVTVMRPAVPPWVAEALRRSLAKTPADRFHPVAQFADAIAPRATTEVAPPARPARRPAGTVPIAAAAVTVVALAVGVAWFSLRRAPAAPLPGADPTVLAVLPFEVRGSDEFAYLREGMIDLVSAKLDGVGGLRVVDPNATVASLAGSAAGLMTAQQARRVSATLGAGRALQGTIVQVGGALQVGASVYGPGEGDRIDASVDGPADRLFALVDELVRALVARGLIREETPLSSLEGLTTSSNEALRLYLEGIHNFRIGRGAQESFGPLTRAVALDSTFALASYWAGYVADYDGIEDPQPHYQLALRHQEHLGQRDRMRLPATIAAAEGRQADAIRLYETFVARYADDLAGWFQLGEQLAHTGRYVGRTLADARPAYERAIALDPALAPAYYHLTQIAGLQGDTAALQAWATRLDSSGVDSVWIALTEMVRALVVDDTVGARQPFERMRVAESDIPAATFAGSIAGLFAATLEYAPRASRALLREFGARALTDTARIVAAREAVRVDIAGGRVEAADSALRNVAAALGTALPQDLAWIALHPANRSRARIEAAARALTAVSPRPGTGEAAARQYLLAMLALRLGRQDAFAQGRAALRNFAAASPTIDRFARDLTSELDAMAAGADGDPRRALESLLNATYWERAQSWRGFREPTFLEQLPRRFPMFLRAELLREAGQDSAAAVWYRVAAEDEWYRAPALVRLAEIRARQGASDEAAELRRRARALWADGDGHLEEIVDARRDTAER